MDIFDLSVEEFENRIDELLKNISQEDLLEKLIINGLEVDLYENEENNYYMEKINNRWVHNNRTSKKGLANIFSRNKNKKQNEDLMEAA